MKQLILILSIFSLLLFGAWGCPENPEKPKQSTKETIGAAETSETTQAGMGNTTEIAKAKAKRIIEEMKAMTPGSTEETK